MYKLKSSRIVGSGFVIIGLFAAGVALADIVSGISTTGTSQNVTITQLTLSKPTDATSGDFLLADVSVDGGSPATITTPTGWTMLARTDNDTNISVVSYWKIVGSSEPTSYTWNISPQTHAAGGITRYTGVDPINPIDTIGTSTGRGTAATAPSITTSHNNEKVVALFGTNTGKSNGETFATSTGMTKLYDVKNTPFGPTVMVENMAQASIGPTGIISSTFSSGPSHDWATQVISLRGSGDLQNGILAYWKMDGNSADATGNGHTGTDTTITYSGANGIINQGAGMSAANNSFVAVNDSSALKPTGQFTVSGWVKTTNSGISKDASLFQSYSQNTSVAGFRLSQSNRKMEIIVGQNTGLINGLDYKQVDSMSNMDDGLWHMWTAVYDGSRLSIYKDGNSTPDASDISTINPEYASTNYVRIGDHNFNGTDYDTADASMDEVGLWNRALSSAEISQLYNGGIGLQHPF